MPSRKKFRKNKRKSRKRNKKGGQIQPNGYALNSDHVADYYFNKALNQVDSEGRITYRDSKIKDGVFRSKYRLGGGSLFGSKKKEYIPSNMMELSILRIMNDFIEKYNNSSSTEMKIKNVNNTPPKKRKEEQEKKFEFDSEELKTISKRLVEFEKKEKDAYDVPTKDEKYSIYKENIKKKHDPILAELEDRINRIITWNKKCMNPLLRYKDDAWRIVLENKTREQANKEKLNYTSKKEYVKGNTYKRGDYVFITENIRNLVGRREPGNVMYVASRDGTAQSEKKEMKELKFSYSSSSPKWERHLPNLYYGDVVPRVDKRWERDAMTEEVELENTPRVEIIKRHEEHLKKVGQMKQELMKKLETAESYDDLSKKLVEIDNQKEQLAKKIIDEGWESENAFLTASNNDLLGKKLDSIGKYIWHSPFMYRVKMWGHYEKKTSYYAMDEKKLSKERQTEGLTPENCGKLLLACVLLIVHATDSFIPQDQVKGIKSWPLDRKWKWTIGNGLGLVTEKGGSRDNRRTNEKGQIQPFFNATRALLNLARSTPPKGQGLEYRMTDRLDANEYQRIAQYYTQYDELDIDKKFLVKTLYKNIIKSLTEDYYKSEDNKIIFNKSLINIYQDSYPENYISDGLYKNFIDKKPYIRYKKVEMDLKYPDGGMETGITIKGNTGGGRKRRRRKKRTRKRHKGKSRRKKRTRRR